jgi:hypothetical protein
MVMTDFLLELEEDEGYCNDFNDGDDGGSSGDTV